MRQSIFSAIRYDSLNKQINTARDLRGIKAVRTQSTYGPRSTPPTYTNPANTFRQIHPGML